MFDIPEPHWVACRGYVGELLEMETDWWPTPVGAPPVTVRRLTLRIDANTVVILERVKGDEWEICARPEGCGPTNEPPLRSKSGAMDDASVEAIERILKRGDRVELIPAKDGVKVVHIKRETVKT